MKVALFCGGYGTRLREYSETVPKPLVHIGDRPILWHLMKYYAYYGHKEFLLCLGYRGQMIKEFFLNYDDCLFSDFTLAEGGARVELHGDNIREWQVTFLDTGLRSNIGQRLLRIRHWLEDEEIFLANYSDGLCDAPLDHHIRDFRESGAIASFLAVRPSNSFSGVDVGPDGYVRRIDYLSRTVLINGGFFIFRNEIFDYMNEGEELVEEPFNRLIKARKLLAQPYLGFWSAMDTFKDKSRFDNLHESGERPWEVWNGEGSATKLARVRSPIAAGTR